MITIVSGLPRSGTSMMMQILKNGGISLLVDDIRQADSNNKKGYFEYEKVKSIKRDKTWFKEAEDKAIKIVSIHLTELPDEFNYKIIFMERDMHEIISSQNKMIKNLGNTAATFQNNSKILSQIFTKQIENIKSSISSKNNIEIIYINYNETIKSPENNCIKIKNFLNDENIDLSKMIDSIDNNLYREKK